MSNANKRKGSQWEQAICDYLCSRGFAVERRVQGGSLDRGDIAGLDHLGVAIEAKNVAKVTLAQFVDEANHEAKNAGVAHGVAVVKRRNHSTARAYAVMDLETFVALLQRLDAEKAPGDA